VPDGVASFVEGELYDSERRIDELEGHLYGPSQQYGLYMADGGSDLYVQVIRMPTGQMTFLGNPVHG